MIYRSSFYTILTVFLFIQGCSSKKQSAGDFSLSNFDVKESTIAYSDFIGSNDCQTCHLDIYSEWKISTHGQAGGIPNSDRVIAPFTSEPIQLADAIVYPEKKNGIYQFRIRYKESEYEEVIRVEAVIGKGFLYGGGTQTFFGEYPDGTYRFLPFDFSKDESSWFVQLKSDEKWAKINKSIGMIDLYNWPPHRVLGEVEDISNCQQCHGSQIITEKLDSGYDTKFVSLSVNCESCHGPAKNHVTIMSNIVKNIVNTKQSIGIASLSGLQPKESLDLCFQCHAVKTPLKPGYLPGENLSEFYSLRMALLGNENPYSIDGRIKSFGYQQNHLFSDCFLSGSMTCISCHNPHSQNYQDINRIALIDRFDDRQCTSCHMAKINDISSHTFHDAESEGSSCISCHMPFRQQRAIGTEIKYTRSDHTISIPRPVYDSSQGFESSCIQCHSDISENKLQTIVDDWYGPIKPQNPVIANRLKITESTLGDDAAKLLLQPDLVHSMGQFSNLSYFIKRYLTPGMEFLDPEIVQKLITYAESEDIDLKALALAGLHYSQYNNLKIQKFIVKELDELGDKEESVRRRWGLILDYFGTVYYLSGDRPNAIQCYELARQVLPDDKTIKTNLSRARS